MSKTKNVASKPVYIPPSLIVWTDERLAALDKKQLANLLENLHVQRSSGRISDATAEDLAARIQSRLPTRAAARRKRPILEVRMEARAAEQLGSFAKDIERRFDLSLETARNGAKAPKGFRPRSMTDSKGQPRSGGSVKTGAAQIERYVGLRASDSFAGLAFVVLANQEPGRGYYVVLGTDDVFEGDGDSAYAAVAEQHGWSAEARARMRARPVSGFDEGTALCETMIAKIAAPIQ
jgi:hypothetical protein